MSKGALRLLAEVVDGQALEGGGQVLRSAIALCGAQRRDVTIESIRGGRSKPGLAAQHLASLRLVAEIAGGRLEGDVKGSEKCSLLFDTPEPKRTNGVRSFTADAGTAGATTLMLQAALPVIAQQMGVVELVLRGGTNAMHAPPIDHVQLVLKPLLAKMGVFIDVLSVRRGFFPEGGGEVVARVSSKTPLKPIDLSNLESVAVRVDGIVFGRGLLRADAQRVASTISAKLLELDLLLDPAEVSIVVDDSRSTWAREASPNLPHEEKRRRKFKPTGGVHLCLTASSGSRIGADSLFDDYDIQRAASGAVSRLASAFRAVKGGVDEHTADQLIVFMALANGRSKIRAPYPPSSKHLETVIHYATRFTGAAFTVEVQDDSQLITCEGAGKQEPPGSHHGLPETPNASRGAEGDV
ncbi:RNA 3'-terminal phosphate cyclase domain-containing protein [Pelagophyceae sp. CCMP2097]|nr:RNA 3'-terminal phosphate cyclase domain-containing protein [Pelagophyceae sp. CCMP2097]